MTFLEAALEVLKRERKPLHYRELTEKAMERKLLTFVGRTPEVTMQTQLTTAVKKAPGAPFVRVKPGIFGLLRYPEGAPEPEEQAAPPAIEEKPPEATEAGDALARGRRRRRGGRGRRRNRRGGDEVRADGSTAPGADDDAAASDTTEPDGKAASLVDEHDSEEPHVGSMSAEARAAALAETGVLEGDIDQDEDDENGDSSEAVEVGEGADEAVAHNAAESDGAAGPAASEANRHEGRQNRQDRQDRQNRIEENEGGAPDSADAAIPEARGEASAAQPAAGESTPAAQGPRSAHGRTSSSTDSGSQAGRRVMSPVDAAIEILKSQSPGRGVHVRQIADSAVRRRLIHGEPNEAWRVMRAALASEGKERLRAGVRPRVKAAGSGLYALSRRTPDADLEKSEYVFGEARRALRERTLAAIEQRLSELTPAAFEAIARVLLQREGFGPATFVKRVETTIYVEALRGRGFRPSKCLIALRPGVAAAGRRALGELRAGIRARGQDEGVLILAGRLADDAIAEWKQPGQPVEVVDGPAMAETCVRHGIGVISANVAVDLIDADFFAELSEG